MSIIHSGFGFESRSDIFDPFSFDLWDPLSRCPFFNPAIVTPSSDQASVFADTRINRKETLEAHIFKADLSESGLKKEEVDVEEGRVLQISGEHSKEQEEKNDKSHRVKRGSRKFIRMFRLPKNAKMEQVNAAMENRVLTITVPKEEMKFIEIAS